MKYKFRQKHLDWLFSRSRLVACLLLILATTFAGACNSHVAKDVPPAVPVARSHPPPSTSNSGIKKSIRSARKPSTGKALDYSLTTFGEIPGISGSRQASCGILVDLDSRRVIWAKNARQALPIASMTKMMTALLVLEDIDSGKLSFDTKLKISPATTEVRGNTIPLDVREILSVRELFSAMLIGSKNDAAFALAENLGNGNVQNFIDRMNARADSLGFRNMDFFNPHGMPGASAEKDNKASAEELVMLAEILLEYPDAVKYSSSPEIYLKTKFGKDPNVQIRSTNFLVRNRFPGVNGMKTGYTDRAGCCLVATCERDGRRLAAVASGFSRMGLRDDFMRKLLDWGYSRMIPEKQRTQNRL